MNELRPLVPTCHEPFGVNDNFSDESVGQGGHCAPAPTECAGQRN
mgnify:FL=1